MDNGLIILADISFKNKDDMFRCKIESGYEWDEEEAYMVIDELMDNFLELGFNTRYTQVSKYAGVLELRKNR